MRLAKLVAWAILILAAIPVALLVAAFVYVVWKGLVIIVVAILVMIVLWWAWDTVMEPK